MRHKFEKALPQIVTVAATLTAGHALAEAPVSVSSKIREQAAHAQMVEPFFDELDCENLGYVQPGEVEEHIGPIFISFDADRSQNIDALEWRHFPYIRDKALMQLSFSVADRDGNNSVSFREFTEYLSLAVASLDSDGNGELSPAELDALLPED